MKKSVLLLICAIFLLGGCGSSSSSSNVSSSPSSSPTSSTSTSIPKTGQSITLSDVTPVCSSKENVDKLLSYLREKNDSGLKSMYSRGEVKDLPKGTKVNVVQMGIVTEVETTSGTHWFAPMELFK